MNEIIKDYAKASNVKLWQVAERMGMHDSNFSKLLRHPLPEKDEEHICRIIDRISDDSKEED